MSTPQRRTRANRRCIWTGEYRRVLILSRDPWSLRKLHYTPITPGIAQHLLTLLAAHHGRPMPTLYWGVGRAQASFRHNRISLPSLPFMVNTRTSVGSLTVGLILHEFAHLLAPVYRGNGRRDPHGHVFTIVLDCLVALAPTLLTPSRIPRAFLRSLQTHKPA